MEPKKLYRSETNQMLCGVCAGVAEYFNIDPTLVRLLCVVLCFATFSSFVIAYIIAAIIIPPESKIR